MSQPITLYGHVGGPNPWKVAIVLEELNIPYKTTFMDFADLKKPPFEKLNPNGRVPAIEDPNTGVALFESGAIIEYLQETYDKNNTLTYTTSPEKYLIKSWLHFQMSGQGPYFGQGAWFTKFHPEQIQSAKDRYLNEIKRVVGVLDRHLEGKQYLVGDKATIADLAFVPWDGLVNWIFLDQNVKVDVEKEFPNYYAWDQRILARPAVKKVLEEKAASSAQKH